jgi:cyclopropane fatty-acyl-phospholipid synthase-like methyltransferase
MPPKKIKQIYKKHPLNKEAILKRLASADLPQPSSICLRDLYSDDTTEITDQNHVGGARFVHELAKVAIKSRDKVLDLGCGIGGPARILAHFYDCDVYGLDLSPERCKDATVLNKLAHLNKKITIIIGDYLQPPKFKMTFDVLWGQGSWLHVPDLNHFFGIWRKSLKTKGVIAFEETYLKQAVQNKKNTRRLQDLSDLWASHFRNVEEWKSSLLLNGFEIEHHEELSQDYIAYLQKLVDAALRSPDDDYPIEEIQGWRFALELAKADVLGYTRIVARLE